MSRRRALRPRPGTPVRPDLPVAGHYLMPLVKGGIPVTVRIWFGPPLDPATGEEIDRSPRWNVEIDGMISDCNGELLDVFDRAWPWCAKRPISEGEYSYRRAVAAHASAHEPAMPEAQPHRKINRMETPTPW